jgi:putative DNA primase/helicase
MDASPATADLDEIRAGLAAGIEALSLDLLGEPTAKGRSEWRWGRRGSLSVVVRGPKHGLWHDHERGEGGDALSWTRRFLGMPDPHGAPCQDDPRERTRRPQRREEARGEPEEDADDAARLARARRLWGEGEPLAGTPAEAYLTEVRRIPKPASGSRRRRPPRRANPWSPPVPTHGATPPTGG